MLENAKMQHWNRWKKSN